MTRKEEAKMWLSKHAHVLEPEDILSETEKQEHAFKTEWPTPEELPGMGIFAQITTPENFNNVVGNPENWDKILKDGDLFEKWVLPHAILFFGKVWFDRVKWAKTISKGSPFPLFSQSDKDFANKQKVELEYTPMGKARISQIIEKTSHSLRVYLKGKWYSGKGSIKPVGGYIVESIKHELVREVAKDCGAKLRPMKACPRCLSIGQKSVVVRHSNTEVSCSRCSDLSDNLKLTVNNLLLKEDFKEASKFYLQYLNVSRFVKFHQMTCVCPNLKCSGKHVPLSSLDLNKYNSEQIGKIEKELGKIKNIPQNTYKYKEPLGGILGLHLMCPYCSTSFTPCSARRKTKKSGLLSGLPVTYIWDLKTESLDKPNMMGVLPKDMLVDTNSGVQLDIIAKQRLSVLVDELVINLAKIDGNTMLDLLNRYFYLAAIKWMRTYWLDASAYFFGMVHGERDLTEKEKSRCPDLSSKKTTKVLRGREAGIHQSFFQTWMDVLEQNIQKFTDVDPSITELSDFVWFCSPPKFNGGPRSTFFANVDLRKRIANMSPVREFSNSQKPRVARVLSIYRADGKKVDMSDNFVEDVKSLEWQKIHLKSESSLMIGEKVRVEVLLMSGHPTHAPIQRILRLRSRILKPIIETMLEEDRSEERFGEFWEERSNLVKSAYNKLSTFQMGD